MSCRASAVYLHADPSRIRAERLRMRGHSVPLTRPVVILGGWRSPSIMTRSLAARLAPLTSGVRSDFLCVSYPLAASIERAAEIARQRIEVWLPTRGDHHAIDIIAISMGGLAARLLASGGAPGSRRPSFRVDRLFTLATPHRGAALARWIRPDRAASAMREGSALLGRLDAAMGDPGTRPREIICYAQRLDWWVGTWNTAPRGHALRCVRARGPFSAAMSHFTVHQHPLVVLDMAARLRGEKPPPGIAAV